MTLPLQPAFVKGSESARGVLLRAGIGNLRVGHPVGATPELGTEEFSVSAPDHLDDTQSTLAGMSVGFGQKY